MPGHADHRSRRHEGSPRMPLGLTMSEPHDANAGVGDDMVG
jgi:hypothetical protein